MNPTVTLALIIAFLTATPLVLAYVLWRRSFVHPVQIAIQTGNDPGDVVWASDMCKVYLKDNSTPIVKFRTLKGEAQSPEGRFWTKMLPKNLEINLGGKNNKGEDVQPSVWKTSNVANKLNRGLFFYRTIDGQYHPMDITKQGDFRVLTSDNRAFLIQCDREATALMMTGRQQLIAVIAVVVGLIILGIAFVLFLVYLGQNVDSFCGAAQGAANSGFVQTVTEVAGA